MIENSDIRQLHSPGLENETDQLMVVETEEAYLVTSINDPEDWLVCFQKRGDFPGRQWAERMAKTYNQRRSTPPSDRPLKYNDC